MPSASDRIIKRARVADVRRHHGGAALVLTSHEAVSWYLDGVRSHVSLAGPPVLAVRVDDAGDHLFVASNEVDRLCAEELLPEDAERVVSVPWRTAPAAAAGDAGGFLAEQEVAPHLRAARASLLPGELDRYRAAGRDVAEIMTDVAQAAAASDSERKVASVLAAEVSRRGIDPLVLLVAGSERIAHRHPLPTSGVLGDRAMMVVCGRRDGMVVNATRWIGAAGRDDEVIMAVEAEFFEATRPGARLDDAFAAGCAAYARNRLRADESDRHHQGGPTGYAGRDPKATGDDGDLIQPQQAFAWNPSAPGAKIEDTVLVGPDGIEVLTLDPRWPSTQYRGLARPLARQFG